MDTIMHEGLNELEAEREELDARIADKQDALAAAERQFQELVADLLAADESERPGLIQQRALLAAERDALQDELSELQRRRNVAHLGFYELQVQIAQEDVESKRAVFNEAHRALNALLENRRRLLNTAKGQEPGEVEPPRVKLDVQIAKARSASRLAEGDLKQTRRVLEHAERELSEAFARVA